MAMASVTLDSTWQQVFDGTVGNVIIQASASCMLAIATSAPGAGTEVGIKLRERPQGAGYEFASGGLLGQKIYMRETSGENNAVATIASW